MSEHILVTLSKKLFENQDNQLVYFVDNKDANNLLNDLENMPHAFVLGCLMDRKSRVERTWLIPYRIKELVGTFEINELAEITREEYVNLFTNNNLHRFNNEMALVFHSAVQEIKKKYNGDVSRIWSNNPGSAKVVYEFLQFYGCGIKIATMAANILATRFKIPFSDYYSIDISPDTHVNRVIRRTGLVPPNADIDSIIYKARELNPEFPGIIDVLCWEIGREWCRPNNPKCEECIINSECKKVIASGQ